MKWTNSIKNRLLYSCTISLLLLFNAVSCSSRKSSHESAAQEEIDKPAGADQTNMLTPQEQTEGWVLLFDGKTTGNWRKVYGKEVPPAWVVKNGVLTVQSSNGRQGGGGGKFGSIVTKKTYGNFEFKIDFKLSKATNTGIKYFVTENPAFFQGDPKGRGIGLEYQLVDDGLPVIHPTNSTAALYAMIPPDSSKKQLHPPGQWNHAKIVSKGEQVQHWLNGKKVLQYRRGSKVFKSLVAESKYNKYTNFGLAARGHILLQDHGTRASFRNIKIRKIQPNK